MQEKQREYQRLKILLKKPLDYENVFERNELGDPQIQPKRKHPAACKTLSSKKYLIPQKNISNAKQDKLSNHRQEHPTKKIQEFMQKSVYSNVQEPRGQIFPMGYNEGITTLK